MGMTAHTPSIIILLDKRRRRIKGIAAGSAEEMTLVVGGAAGDDDVAFDGRATGFAARGEELVVVEVAVEAGGDGVEAVGEFEVGHFLRGRGFGGERWGEAGLAGVDAGQAVVALGVRFRVEGDEFQVRVALVADEAGGVETFAGGAEDAAVDWQGAVGAEGAGLADCGGQVGG